MKPDKIPNSITAAELAALGELALPDAELPLAPVGGERPVSAVERRLFGALADPAYRRAVEAGASGVRRAVEAVATEASLWEAGRVPEPGGEVIYRGGPATILRVREPGEAMSALDLLQYRHGEPEAHAAVQHDRDAGWHWLGEPPPPDPTAADRIRAAVAAGRPVPKVEDVVRLMRTKPRSYLGTEMVGLRARVVAVVDVVGPQITLDLEVLDEPVEGLDPANSSGLVRGVVGPDEHREGWAIGAWASRIRERDTRNLHLEPCDRCGGKLTTKDAVQFLSRTFDHYTNPRLFAQLCPTCADQFGRLAFVRPPVSNAPPDDDLDELS